MLELTEQAEQVIRGIIEDANLGPDGGLRITSAGNGNGEIALEFDVVDAALDGDETVSSGGATVFLDSTAAEVLADKRLDVHAHGDHFHFSVDEKS